MNVRSDAEISKAFDDGHVAQIEPRPRLADYIDYIDAVTTLHESSLRAALAIGGNPGPAEFRKVACGRELLLMLFRIKENERAVAKILVDAAKRGASRG